ncbi:hydrogenase maturation protease [Nostoc sp. CMAA1605]|uniref:hydrogenase maturation protease n=1 Tax=Nostoc sp. CMAA1605 TaxID=2055159 RepID=UPI001F401B4F|nr:hydrogenase maturation protease [Nostoc sp. CMAA1605]MCF4965959.1 hydrogenase maturation protease [Nostoc sp. CMAA1605]
MNKTVMVIGYGNELRSDDGIGQQIANEIANWHLPSVKSLAIQQLTPDLAASLAKTDLAIFVDACLPTDDWDVQIQPLSPSDDLDNSVHICDPRSLLALTQALYGYSPTAWLVTIPGFNFEIGDRLSRIAEIGKSLALLKIIQILDRIHTYWVEVQELV